MAQCFGWIITAYVAGGFSGLVLFALLQKADSRDVINGDSE